MDPELVELVDILKYIRDNLGCTTEEAMRVYHTTSLQRGKLASMMGKIQQEERRMKDGDMEHT